MMVSVIIPVYNRKKYIETCIRSVMRQTYDEWETLIIDDGSTDGTLQLCEKIAKEDSRIHIYKCEHRGVSASRNKGLLEAKGEFVFFLDSDDAIHPCLIDRLVKQMDNPCVNLAFCGCMLLNDSQIEAKLSQNVADDEQVPDFCVVGEETFMENFVYEKIPKIYVLGGKMFRKSSIEKIRFNEKLRLGEDTVFVYEYALTKGLSAIGYMKWYYYRQHDGNTVRTCRKDLNDIKVRLNALDLIIRREERRGKTEYVHKWQNMVIARLKSSYEKAHIEHEADTARKIGKMLYRRLSIYERIPASVKERFKLWVYIYFFPMYKVFNFSMPKFLIPKPAVMLAIRIKWVLLSVRSKVKVMLKTAFCYLRESRCIKKWF